MAQRQRQKSEYGQQLAEKQKIRSEYGLRERQFKNYFKKGKTPESIFGLLESRLDITVFKSGLAPTRAMARQMVSHGHVTVNERKVTIASYKVKVGDIIAIKEASKEKGIFGDFELRTKNYEPPSWISLDKKKKEAKVKASPDMREQELPFSFQTVIEFYSR
ncbi:MAG: 30S ribosomal protein S4 [Candidatus Spechtbacterales bacterium]